MREGEGGDVGGAIRYGFSGDFQVRMVRLI